MSRELKFRAWDGEKMISPDYIDRKGVAWWKENSIATKSDIVMQYIGSSGVYEGDIVLSKDTDTKFKVVYDSITSAFLAVGLNDKGGDFLYVYDSNKFKVIGNIYQHKHLLI